MSRDPSPDEPSQKGSASTSNLVHALSSKRRQIILTADLARRILDAAQATGNNIVYEALQTHLPRGCLILRHDQLPVRPPNPAIIAEEIRLQARLVEIAQITIAMRQKAKPVLLERARKTAHAAVSRLLANPKFPVPFDPDANLDHIKKPSSDRPKYVDDTIDKIASLPPAIQKTRHQATNTREKLANIHKVLGQLKDNAVRQTPTDATPTVHADWTILVKESLNTPANSSPTIPIQPPLTHDDDPDDQMASPFVTPRSKARKRAARSVNDMDPIRFQISY